MNTKEAIANANRDLKAQENRLNSQLNSERQAQRAEAQNLVTQYKSAYDGQVQNLQAQFASAVDKGVKDKIGQVLIHKDQQAREAARAARIEGYREADAKRDLAEGMIKAAAAAKFKEQENQ